MPLNSPALPELHQGRRFALPELRLTIASPDVERPLSVAVLLADCNRARILALLQGGPHCVCELAASLGEQANNVSNHLARLREAGLVVTSQLSGDARRVYYERDEAACAIALAQMESLLRPTPRSPSEPGSESEANRLEAR